MAGLAAVGASTLVSAVPAQADPNNSGSNNPGASDAGHGSISQTIDEFGQSLCPKLVKPGSDLATAVSEMQGNTGLGPTLTGMVTGFAIQMQCPAFMTSLANGDLSKLQLPTGGKDSAGPLHLPGS